MKKPCWMAVAGCIAAAGWSATALAADDPCQSRWFAHLGGTTTVFDDRHSENQTGSGVRLGLGRRNCAVRSGHSRWELNFSATAVDGAPRQANDQVGVEIDRLRLYRAGAWQPFWRSGVGFVREYVRDGGARWFPAVSLGGGVLFELFPYGAAVRLDAGVQGIWNDDIIPGEPFHHDARFTLALVVPFRGS